MIKLEVDDYCHDCPQFRAETETPVFFRDANGGEILMFRDSIVRCEHRLHCRQIYKHLAKKYEEKDKKEI